MTDDERQLLKLIVAQWLGSYQQPVSAIGATDEDEYCWEVEYVRDLSLRMTYEGYLKQRKRGTGMVEPTPKGILAAIT